MPILKGNFQCLFVLLGLYTHPRSNFHISNWKTLPSEEENNEFFSVYIKYNILVCYPGVKNQLQLEL